MSDFEDDIDDQLLELAGATEKKKKRRQHSNSNGTSYAVGGLGVKKRKAEYALFIQFKSNSAWYSWSSLSTPCCQRNSFLFFFGQPHLFREMNFCWFIAPGGWNLNPRRNRSRVKMTARIYTRWRASTRMKLIDESESVCWMINGASELTFVQFVVLSLTFTEILGLVRSP